MLAEIFIPNTSQHIETINHLGLEQEWLQEVGMKAIAAYNQTTSHDAMSAPGTYAYFAAIRAIRDILCQKGWEPHVKNNLEMTVNPKTKTSIIVSSGNKDTGRKDHSPKTKNPKGNQTKRAVAFNERQFRLPTMEYKVKNIQLNKIWIFLFHVDTKKSQLRAELSLPVKMDIEELHVSGWHKRIILPSIDVDHFPAAPKHSNDLLPEFNVELKRKANG